MAGCKHSTPQCNTCASRKKREKNPMRYAYDTLKSNCVRRHGEAWFYLTFEEFAQYAYETKYLQGKGRSKMSWSIDKIDPEMGYFIGNIRPLQVGNNSRKHTKKLNYEWDPTEQRMVAWVV